MTVAVERHEEVLIALRRIMRATDMHSKWLMKRVGLTVPQLMILRAIESLGAVGIGSVAVEVSLSQATVTTILNRLERRGLVRRERSPTDKRIVNAFVTDAGRVLLQQAPTPIQDEFVDQFRQLPDYEQTLMVSAIQRVAHMMDAHDIDAAPMLDIAPVNAKADAPT
ncbi:MAG: MarR family transcriptional regulator [Pseudomonadota bacterium]|nr:MarR family transcriptional regulator [Pseudomonadota bacterium]